MMEAFAPAVPGPGGNTSGHGFSGARQGEGLWKVFMKDRSVSSVAQAAAEDVRTYKQEFQKKDTIIPFSYEIKNNRWTNKGRTLEEISVGGDRLSRVLTAESRMMSDPSISQAVVASEDLGYGRNYLYIFNRGKEDPNTISAIAIEHQGSNGEFLNLMRGIGERSVNASEKNDFTADFATPLFYTAKDAVSVQDVYRSAKTSYTTEERREEVRPFLQRLAKDTYYFDDHRRQSEEEDRKLTRQIEAEARKILEDKDTQEAFGLLGQSLSALAKGEEKERAILPKWYDEVREPVRIRENQASPSIQDVQLTNVPNFRAIAYLEGRRKKRMWKEHNGGHGFRRHRRKIRARLTGLDLVTRKLKPKVEEAGKAFLSRIKNKYKTDTDDRLEWHSSKYTAHVPLVIHRYRDKSSISPSLTEASHTHKKEAKTQEHVHTPTKQRQMIQEKDIFVDGLGRVILDGVKSQVQIRGDISRVPPQKKIENRQIVSESKKQVPHGSKKEIITTIRKNKDGLKKSTELGLTLPSEKKRLVISRKLRQELRVLKKVRRFLIRDQRRGQTGETNVKFVKLVESVWGKDSLVYQKIVEGKMTRKGIRAWRKDILRRFKKLEFKSGKEKRIKKRKRVSRERLVEKRMKKRTRFIRFEAKLRRRKENLRHVKRKVGVIFDSFAHDKKRSRRTKSEKSLLVQRKKRKSGILWIHEGKRRLKNHRIDPEVQFLQKNKGNLQTTIGFRNKKRIMADFCTGHEVEYGEERSFEHLSSYSPLRHTFLPGSRAKKRKYFPRFGIIYSYT